MSWDKHKWIEKQIHWIVSISNAEWFTALVTPAVLRFMAGLGTYLHTTYDWCIMEQACLPLADWCCGRTRTCVRFNISVTTGADYYLCQGFKRFRSKSCVAWMSEMCFMLTGNVLMMLDSGSVFANRPHTGTSAPSWESR